jgi:hypothetical protein
MLAELRLRLFVSWVGVSPSPDLNRGSNRGYRRRSCRPPQMPSLEDMKRMADKKAEPLLAKLKTDLNNPDLLNQIGTLYKATHQFEEAGRIFSEACSSAAEADTTFQTEFSN